MNTLIVGLALVAPVPVSYVVEALRPKPKQPIQASWAPEIKYQYVEVDGSKIRYIKTGTGPTLVLLHTLRTQLDMWQKVIPELSKDFTIYAMDHIGHGFSDIPKSEYTPEAFRNVVAGFMQTLDINDATIIGESIGGSLGLILAAESNPRVNKVIAINPYDYGQGRGIHRSSLIARVLFSISNVPIFGATFWRLRAYPIFLQIMRGGVANNKSLPKQLIHEINAAGDRQGHYQAFMNLIKHFPKWQSEREKYHNIKVPVLLLYGASDWSTPEERAKEQALIPQSKLETVANAGHFMSLDYSDLASRIRQFVTNGI
ncbi:MAG: alpha/beta hydrolase [Piscirickettsiaceae bacterium]|nr:alpha/beta hydrolase [Piscirickettsiaceae bacterium]